MLYCTEISARIDAMGKSVSWYDFFLQPFIEFVRVFIAKHGYRDGTIGLLWALHAADASFRTYALMWDQRHKIPRKDVESALSQSWEDYEREHRKEAER